MRKERLGVSQENTVGWETHDKTLKRLRGIVVTSREISFVTYHKNRSNMRCVIDSTLNTAYTPAREGRTAHEDRLKVITLSLETALLSNYRAG